MIVRILIILFLCSPAYALNITLNRTQIDIDNWHYRMNFINDSDSPIWHFLAYTESETSNIFGSFPFPFCDRLAHFNVSMPLGSNFKLADGSWYYVKSGYDLRWFDPDVTHMQTGYCNYLPEPNVGLDPGHRGWFEFDMNAEVDKILFAYETVASGGVYMGDDFAEIDYAYLKSEILIPEPISLILVGSGLVGLGVFSRKKFKS